MEKRIKCVISYDGTHFSGFQIQPRTRTIQGEIERVLMKMHKNKYIRIYASGRTDAGVHAIGQVFHFDTILNLSNERWKRAFNALLPEDIYVHSVTKVSHDFHSRFDAIEKEYRYFVLNSKERDLFNRHFMYHCPENIDLTLMKRACRLFEGTHDFTSFCSQRSTVKGSKVRTLYEVTCKKEGEEIQFTLEGNGFLYNMVRIIVSTLLDVGTGKISLDEIPNMFQKKDRTVVGKTLPPEGLFLWKVKY